MVPIYWYTHRVLKGVAQKPLKYSALASTALNVMLGSSSVGIRPLVFSATQLQQKMNGFNPPKRP